MELMDSYKKTEIGVIPNDWELKKISDIVSVDTENLSSSTNPEYEFKYISLEDVDNGTLRNYAELTFKNAPSRARRKIRKGDILVATVRPNLKSHLFISQEVSDWICSTGFSVLRSNSNVDGRFLFSHLFVSIINKQIDNLITGSNYPAINSNDVKSLTIPLPPLPEQQAIAEVLSDTDNLIQSLEKLIAKKRLIKQGAMQELLSPKEGWEVKKLGDVADIVGGGTPSTFINSYWDGTINWFTPTEIGFKKYVTESSRKITIEGLQNCSAKILPMGTILLTSRAGIGDLGILKEEGCTNQGFQSLVPKEGINTEFLYYLMITLKKVLVQNASGSTFLEISPNRVKQIQISCPNTAEQIRIALILTEIDNEIESLEKKLSKYKVLKQGLMQNLLTGKIRLV